MPLSVIALEAPNDGPTVVIAGNLHGDECTGIGVIHGLVNILMAGLLRGRVAMYPSLNPDGLVKAERGMPGQDLDPNRAFPGRRRGDEVERHAHRIWQDMTGRAPDLLIDLHTDTGGAIPYAIVDRVLKGKPGLEDASAVLAAASGLTVLREYPADRYARFRLDRSLPGAMMNVRGVQALTLEIGPRQRIDKDAVDLGIAATLGVLTAAGLVASPALPHRSRKGGGPWHRENGPRATRDGVLVPLLAPGDDLVPGMPMAEVRALDGHTREVLRAEAPGFLVALAERAWITPGLACATVAIAD